MAKQPNVIEPHRRTTVPGLNDTSVTTGLPDDLQEQQCARIAVLYAVGAAIWAIGLVMHRWVLPNPDKSLHGVVIDGLAITACLLFLTYWKFST